MTCFHVREKKEKGMLWGKEKDQELLSRSGFFLKKSIYWGKIPFQTLFFNIRIEEMIIILPMSNQKKQR